MRRALILLLATLLGALPALAQKAPTLRSYFADTSAVREGGVKLIMAMWDDQATDNQGLIRFLKETNAGRKTVPFGKP